MGQILNSAPGRGLFAPKFFLNQEFKQFISGKTERSRKQSCSSEGSSQGGEASAHQENLRGENFALKEDIGGKGITCQEAVSVARKRDDREDGRE